MSLKYYTQLRKFYRRISFYVSGFAGYAVPRCYYRWCGKRLLRSLSDEERAECERRAAYYCPMEARRLPDVGLTVGSYRYPWHSKHKFVTYFFDLYDVVKHFPSQLRFERIFGDVDFEPDVPSFVKSRPVGSRRGTLLKLNQVRHFRFISDGLSFREKSDRLVFRNFLSPGQTARIAFMERFFGHPLVDAGLINKEPVEGHPEWNVPFMTLDELLRHKFVACIEGNDVATNLKWVMSSNSVAVMPRPKFETWFMEGTLKADYHYIEVRPDYSDLEEKLRYYIAHPEEAEAIIRHAHEYISTFRNARLERATQLLTASRYFKQTGQQ